MARELISIVDGTLFGSGNAFLWRAFVPRWWQVHRWFWWHVLAKRPHGFVTLTYRGAGGVEHVRRVRVVQSEVVLPNVPGPYSEHTSPGVPPRAS